METRRWAGRRARDWGSQGRGRGLRIQWKVRAMGRERYLQRTRGQIDLVSSPASLCANSVQGGTKSLQTSVLLTTKGAR